MNINNATTTTGTVRQLSCLIAALAVGGCHPTASMGDKPASDTAAETGTEFKPWACPAHPGIAPSGSLEAKLVAGSEANDALPRLYEGPVWIEGSLYYSDFVLQDRFPSRIRKFTPPDRFETVVANSGSNGLAVDARGRIVAATHDRKQLATFDRNNGTRNNIIGTFDGQPFNSPNDLAIARDDTIFFTDPAFQRAVAPGGQPRTRVYRYADGKISVVDDSIDNPNGVALSPSGNTLYVAGGGENGVLRAYPLTDGVPGAGTDLARVAVPDGMAMDCLGNVYVTEHARRRVQVFSTQGEVLASIAVDANITNAAFGGDDGRTLYLTGAGRLWSLSMPVAGFPY